MSVRGARKCGLTGGQVQKNGSVNLEEVSVEPMALEAFEITLCQKRIRELSVRGIWPEP